MGAAEAGSHARVEVQILLAMDDAIEPIMLRFLADARKAVALAGPHVERILHVGVTDDGHPFVVREPSSGETLASVLGKWGSLPTEVGVDIAIAICQALESAHAVGLVHAELDATMVRLAYRDDGPSNVKVAGLGTSRALAMLPFDKRSIASDALRAPELRAAGAEGDVRVDVWSVGVLLYTMLAGAAPFSSDSPSKRDVTADGDEPALLAGVPDGLAEVVDSCLAREPARRPQTVASLAARLALYGSRPVFEKRSSLLVVDTGRYEAQTLEQLVKDAGPSAPSIDVELDDMVTAVVSSPSVAPVEMTPEPVVVTRSAPPVAITLPPPALLPQVRSKAQSPATSRKRRATAFAAAACIGIGAAVIAMATRGPTPPSSPAALAAEAPPAAKSDPLPLPAQAKPGAAPAEPRALSITDLPSAPAHARPLTPGQKARAKGAAKGAPNAAAAPPPAAPAADPPAVDPIVHSASAPIQPQPKASDDDLRRFLDDRR